MRWKMALGTAVAGLIFSLAGAGTVQAHDSCFDKIQREEFKLRRDVARHGFFSRQARHRREKISGLRYQCHDRGRSRWDRRGDDRHRGRHDWRRDDDFDRRRAWGG